MTEREALIELLIESHRVFSDDAEELADMILDAGFRLVPGWEYAVAVERRVPPSDFGDEFGPETVYVACDPDTYDGSRGPLLRRRRVGAWAPVEPRSAGEGI